MKKWNPFVRALVIGCFLATAFWNPFSQDSNVVLGQPSVTPNKFQVDPLWPKPLPNDWVTGEVSGTCVDSKDHVFIVTRTADPNNLTEREKEVARPSPPVI